MTQAELNLIEYQAAIDRQTRTLFAWACFFIVVFMAGASMVVWLPILWQAMPAITTAGFIAAGGLALMALGAWLILQVEARRNAIAGVSGMVLASIGGFLSVGAILFIAIASESERVHVEPEPVTTDDVQLKGSV